MVYYLRRGKLSASLDEFRVWKDARTPEEVGRNWFTNINGGTNTTREILGDSLGDTNLGIYFKFCRHIYLELTKILTFVLVQ